MNQGLHKIYNCAQKLPCSFADTNTLTSVTDTTWTWTFNQIFRLFAFGQCIIKEKRKAEWDKEWDKIESERARDKRDESEKRKG